MIAVFLAGAALLAGLVSPAQALEHGPAISTPIVAALDEGLHHLYALDYPQSRRAFQRVIALDSQSPFGYLFDAGGIWWESSQEFGLFTTTPTLQGLFEEDVDMALRTSAAYIVSKDKRVRADGYFVSGMALGTLGQWRLMKRHWIDAFFTGKKAVKHLKKCLKVDSEYADARLGLGVFEYQTAHLSGAMRIGVLFGLKGDEKRGLTGIHYAMDHAPYATHQAAQLLSQIYINELRDYEHGLPVLERLRSDFPESPYFVFLEAVVRHRIGDVPGSSALGRLLYEHMRVDPKRFQPKWLTLVCGLNGADCLTQENALAALSWFGPAIDLSADKPDGYRTMLYLLRGHLYDILGRRDEAVTDYRCVHTLPDVASARARAEQCLQRPCDRENTLQYLRELTSPVEQAEVEMETQHGRTKL